MLLEQQKHSAQREKGSDVQEIVIPRISRSSALASKPPIASGPHGASRNFVKPRWGTRGNVEDPFNSDDDIGKRSMKCRVRRVVHLNESSSSGRPGISSVVKNATTIFECDTHACHLSFQSWGS
ncbi:hypothetical protein LshimejAT787_0704540 [Lyophyllum shimeji]|uniref:Uncharacterized protein n=1 Tax=Lyophyllum shimeji TaxID=47721 RepID=A0A9P3PQZ2_LYOSH|nr:hypothetical protein LshimejAT787_0704540 [Lyophyllum shimeji]